VKKGLDRENPEKRAYKYLNELMDKRIPFNFLTKLELFKNMVITAFDINKSGTTGNALPFTCSMQQVKIVEGKAGDLKAFQDNIEGQSGFADQGQKSGSVVQEETKNISILAATVDAIRGK